MRNTRSISLPKTVGVLLVAGIVLGLLMPSLFAGESGSAPEQQVHMVQAGDTLWALAQEHATGDPRQFIYDLKRINRLLESSIYPGQELILPSR